MRRKRIISILLTLTLIIGTLPVFSTTVSAGVLGNLTGGIAKKGLEVGMRYAVQASMEAAARSETSTALPAVQSIIAHTLLDAQGVTINEISQMCSEILQQISKIETELKEYTAEISSQIAKQNKYEIHQKYEDKWKEDVKEGVLAKEREYASYTGVGVSYVFDAYVKYLIVSTLYAKNASLGSVSDFIKEYWYNTYTKVLSADDYTLTEVNNARENLELQFMKLFNKHSDLSARDTVYKNAGVFHKLNDALDELTNNYVYTGSGQSGYSIVECAATDAFFGLPENSDQYSYVMSAAKKQILYATILQMCINEYLSMQGEYLQSESEDDGWADDVNLIVNSDLAQRSYNDYKEIYATSIETSLERAIELMNANIKIDTSLYTGNTTPVTVTFDDYMKPEDSTDVYLDIVGGAENVDYSSEVEKITSNTQNYEKATDSPDKISSPLSFRRVRMGLGNQVYYILNDTDTTLGSLAHRVKRYGALGIDGTAGDLVVSSADFVNLRKGFTDGTNTFSIPDNFETGYADLLDTPDYTAVHEKNPGTYLAPYLPSNTTGTTYLLSKGYDNKLSGGGSPAELIAPRTGWVKIGKLFGSVNESTIPMVQKNFEDIEGDASNKYAVIAVPTDTYKQKVTFETVDTENAIIDAYILTETNETKYNGESAVLEPSQDITIRFKLKDGGSVKHLKTIRANAQQTETVFFGSDEFINSFTAEADGYYSFTIPMPYSEITIELEATFAKSVETDDAGHYVISTYEDLKTMASNIYDNNAEYAEGHYVLANDIDCSGEDAWVYPIGRDEETAFRGIFDGNGYTISNLYYNNPAEDLSHLGLFGVLDGATVKNLKLTYVSSYAGADNLNFGHICGEMTNQSLISNCYVHAEVGDMYVTAANNIGGICGEMKDSRIEKTINEANISSTTAEYAGGIVGKLVSGTIDYCGNREWVVAEVSKSTNTIGGIVGGTIDTANSTISNSYQAGIIYNTLAGNGDFTTKIIAGGDNMPTMINNYCPDVIFTSEQETNALIYDLATPFKSGEVAYTLNNNNPTGVWKQTIGTDNFPGFDGKSLSKDNNGILNVYIVSFDANGGSGTMSYGYAAESYTLPSCTFTAPEGKAFKSWIVNGEEKNAGDSITLTEDTTISALWSIGCVSHSDDETADGFCDVCGEPIAPEIVDDCYQIGSYGELVWFAENVNVAHKAVLTNDITINPALADWTGISLADSSSSSFDGAGHTITFKNTSTGLFRSYNYSVIENLILDGNIIASVADNNGSGVVVNTAYRTTIRNVTVKANITQTIDGAYTGGIAGYFGGKHSDGKYSLIENCAVYADVNGTGDSGGIIGRIWGGTQYCEVKNCVYVGNVVGTAGQTGAIAGYNANQSGYDSPLTKCYYLCDDSSVSAVGRNNGGTNTLSDVSAKTSEEFENGVVAYLLGSSWGQIIYVDKYPVIGGVKVYKYIDGYSNDNIFGYVEAGSDSVTVNIPKAGTYVLIFADYEGERLNNLETVPITTESDGQTKTVAPTITLGKEDKIMLWQDMESLVPLCGAYTVE